MTVVADASVAAKWYLLEPGRDLARALQSSEQVIAPEWILAEVLNIMWKNVRTGIAGADQVALVVQSLPRQFVKLFPVLPLLARAAEICLDLDHPIYDCFYVALAERERCTLVTADRKLYAKTRRTKYSSLVRILGS
ncbi:MAG TPA: type II toxin-antitoxin system VapC family toxin [Rhizomicrobium sp.]|nr:type II toxin-antitoxin system VapC family toxin [Rhizomicrobium sp.]